MNPDSNNNEPPVIEVKEFYRVLDVEPTATFQEIKDSYKQKCLIHHPDRPGGTSEMFIKITRAYEVLSDPHKRKLYDMNVDDQNIDMLVHFHFISDIIDAFIPIVVHSVVDRVYQFKPHIIASAVGLTLAEFRKDKNNPMGFTYLLAYPLVQLAVERYLSMKFIENRELSQAELKKRTMIIDAVATALAVPFEMGAFRAFALGFPTSSILSYFTLTKNDTIWKQIVTNIIMYFQKFKPSSQGLGCIVGIIVFRFAYNYTNYFFSSISEYCGHRAIASREEYNETIQEQLSAPLTPQQLIQLFIAKSKPFAWQTASFVTSALSYFIPSTLFSVHRLIYKMSSPFNVQYFSWSPLIRYGFLDACSTFGLDLINRYYYYQIKK